MIKVDIFSGFLGAGKTTLIRKLIEEAYQGEKLVLIENEFGEIGVDGSFMQDAGIEISELNSGCICCSLAGDLGKALGQVVEQFKPDRILIEPSGVGKLSDVVGAVESAGVEDLKVNAMTTVVDAKKVRVYMANFGEFYANQVESAHCIIMSRTGGMKEEKLAEAVAILREHNPAATIITTPWEELDGKAILAVLEQQDTLEEAIRSLAEEARKDGHHHHHHDDDDEECGCEHQHHHHDDDDEECGCEDHHHHHDDDDEECGCEHHHHHHDDDEECGCEHHHHHHGHDADEVFVSWGTETPRKYTREELEGMLAALEDTERFGTVLRAKGLLDTPDGTWLYFDHVPEETEIRTGAPGLTGRICVIGSGLKDEALKELFHV